MKRFLTGTLSVILIIAGLAGLVFSGFGIFALGEIQQRVEASVMQQLEVVDRALAATADGLAVADTTLTQAAAATSALGSMASGMGEALEGTTPTLDAVAEMMGEQIPATIKVTQDTLGNIVETAQMVDNFLDLVTSIRLLGLERYNPEVSLSSGVMEVASSLDSIPESLTKAQDGLLLANDSLEMMQGDISGMAEGVDQIAVSLESSRTVIEEYQIVVADLQAMVSTVREGLPSWLQWARIGLSLILVWLGIAQLGLITQGWELLSRRETDTG